MLVAIGSSGYPRGNEYRVVFVVDESDSTTAEEASRTWGVLDASPSSRNGAPPSAGFVVVVGSVVTVLVKMLLGSCHKRVSEGKQI